MPTQTAFSADLTVYHVNGWDPSQTNQGLKIFLLCRQDFPLPPPINRDGFHGLREEKIGSKKSQKISFSPIFLLANVLSSLSLSRCFFNP